MVAATDEVISTRPAPRSTIGGSSRLARWTTAVTLTAISRRSSVRGMSRVKSPLTPIPALSAAASRGRPPSVTAAHSRSTPSLLDRSALTARTDAPVPARPASAAARSSSSAVMIRSKPLFANWRASSSPIPLDAPVTNASCCMGHRSLVGVVFVFVSLPRPSRPVTEVRSAHPRPMPRPGGCHGGGLARRGDRHDHLGAGDRRGRGRAGAPADRGRRAAVGVRPGRPRRPRGRTVALRRRPPSGRRPGGQRVGGALRPGAGAARGVAAAGAGVGAAPGAAGGGHGHRRRRLGGGRRLRRPDHRRPLCGRHLLDPGRRRPTPARPRNQRRRGPRILRPLHLAPRPAGRGVGAGGAVGRLPRDRHAVALAGSPATTPEGYLAPGVVHQAITDPAGPFAIHLVTVHLSAPSTLDLALALDVLPGLETTSSMARRQGATVAVNGDYADPDHAGRPINAFAKDGRLLQTPFLPGNNHAVDDREAAVFMGRPNVQVVAEVPRTGLVLPVAQVNRGAPAGDEVAMFTPEGATRERPPAGATSARLRATGPAAVRADGWAETAYTVEEVGQLGGPVPAGTVLSTPPDGAAAADLAALEPGEEVTVTWSFAAWPGILDTSGGNPTLVRNGRVLAGNVDGTTPFHRRNPRTGVGATADGRLLLVTVDGR